MYRASAPTVPLAARPSLTSIAVTFVLTRTVAPCSASLRTAAVPCDLAQRQGRDANIGGARVCEQAGLHDLGGQRKGCVITGNVDRRDREQVPQRPAGALVLAMAGEEVSEADLVGGFGTGIHSAQREDCLANPSPFRQGDKGISGQRGEQVQGRRAADAGAAGRGAY